MRLFCFLFCFFAVPPLRAEWALESSTLLPVRAPAIQHDVEIVREASDTHKLHVVKFDRSRCGLRVIDLQHGTRVEAAGQGIGALAVVNGGYFKVDRSPLGLVVSQGVKLHGMEHSKILTGVLAITARGAGLLRTEEFHPGSSLRGALQAGPFLVDHGKAVFGLNATRSASRTVLLADERGVRALLVSDSVTLAKLAQILATPLCFPGVKITRALNLDGGSSTALWVNSDPLPFSLPEWKKVRNAVAIVPIVRNK